jgi:predicted nucleic acid-binding protein
MVLVDANVWLYLYPPPINSNVPFFVRHYSSGYRRMIDNGAQPVLDPIILSEYLNRYCRIEWGGQFKSNYPNFKHFRKSHDFRSVARDVSSYATRIVSSCAVHETPTDKLDLNQAIADFESGGIDFNDAILVDICKKHGFKLLTNDGDFKSGGIEVLTNHPGLLRQ